MNIKRIIMLMLATLMVGLVEPIVARGVGASNVVDSETLIELCKDYPESFAFDEEKNTVFFSENSAVKSGMDSETASMISSYFNNLNENERAQLLQEMGEENELLRVAPAVAWAARVLGGWLGQKLLNWGSRSFCRSYRYYNSATRYVCSVIA